MTELRILVTGSRDWTDRGAVRKALLDILASYTTVGRPTLIHGGARGLDSLAGQVWTELAEHVPGGLSLEVHRAEWDKHGKAAGAIRNQQMVNAGAHVCLAFPLGKSIGTRDCMRRAAKVGIRVINHGDLPGQDAS